MLARLMARLLSAANLLSAVRCARASRESPEGSRRATSPYGRRLLEVRAAAGTPPAPWGTRRLRSRSPGAWGGGRPPRWCREMAKSKAQHHSVIGGGGVAAEHCTTPKWGQTRPPETASAASAKRSTAMRLRGAAPRGGRDVVTLSPAAATTRRELPRRAGRGVPARWRVESTHTLGGSTSPDRLGAPKTKGRRCVPSRTPAPQRSAALSCHAERRLALS
jgi:hypothetical protein